VPQDKVLEIGPGLGPLTELLLARAGHVLAIEKDHKLVQVLETLNPSFIDSAKLQLISGDALEFIKREARDWRGWKLVANLPYSVASPILVELALAAHGPERLVVTLQMEVARRLMAKTCTRDYGILTLLVQLSYQPRDFFKIPPGCFYPEPDVDSACISLIRRPQPLLHLAEKEVFVKLVKRGFSQRRKMMLKLLKQDWPAENLSKAFADLSLSPQARAETVNLEQFVALAKYMQAGTQ
jgi:16S rRNA (adenine1518-N6/adenine1519-N6)-dimethyltransferase